VATTAIGDTAIMIAGDGALTAPEHAPDDLKQPGAARNVLGDRVITEAGVDLGAVSDVVIMLGDRTEAVGYELTEDSGAGSSFRSTRRRPCRANSCSYQPNSTTRAINTVTSAICG
jgi:hypothetical protein